MASDKALYLGNGAVKVFADYLNRFLNDFKRAIRQDNNRAMTMTAVGLSQIGMLMEEFYGNVAQLGMTSDEEAELADRVAMSLDASIRADLYEIAKTAPIELPSLAAENATDEEAAPTLRDISQLN